MEAWKILLTILGVVGTVWAGISALYKSKNSGKVESFKSIMEESKNFREEIRNELNRVKEESKKEIESLKEIIHKYEERIQELEERLREALSSKSWLYYYIQKPINKHEIENIIKKYLITPEDHALVVEDDPLTQKIIDELSKNNGWSFIRAYNGKSAIELVKINQPSVIIVDLVLPVTDGFEILNAIHENRQLSQIPIIVISSGNIKDVDRIFLHSKINEAIIKA